MITHRDQAPEPSEPRLPERFEYRRFLGAGGFGAVYEVFDRQLGAAVALKHLRRPDAATVARFKREFRALAGSVHRNLVRLHELLFAGGEWYFSMELVLGKDFRSFVRPGAGAAAPTVTTVFDKPAPGARPGQTREDLPAAGLDPAGAARLRRLLPQLVAGVSALHAASKLHRDLKPSNVLVTPTERLVILDFGMVADLEGGAHMSLDAAIRGTPAYMSPEQSVGAPLGPEADWYSVGVMLYEALAGFLPYDGAFVDMVAAKQSRDPIDPRDVQEGLPDDLVDLALALLRRDPGARPAEAEIVGVVGEPPAAGAAPEAPAAAADATVFVGRTEAHAPLEEARAESRASSRPVVVHVVAPSTVGKTALLRRFADELRAHGRAAVLEGRCYERETVPWKGIDGAVDALVALLRRRDAREVRRLLPRDEQALLRLFPAFAGLEAFARPRPLRSALDPIELRRRGFRALRELMQRLADTTAVVVVIDDFQWGDADGLAVLDELLAPPDPPTLLVCVAYRAEDAEASDLLRELAAREHREVRLGPLPLAEAEELARRLDAPDAAFVAAESGGNPFFVRELALRSRGHDGAAKSTLNHVLGLRIGALAPEARRLGEVFAVAGSPIDTAAAAEAAGLGAAEAGEALAHLRAVHIVRTSSLRGREVAEIVHDRIRERFLAAAAGETLRRHHGSLARVLEAGGDADPEALALHHRGAGADKQARLWSERAGDRAGEALAFDRAAAHYEAALDPAAPPAESHRLWIKLGDALANTARGPEAARAYMAAVAGAQGIVAVDLQRRAAEQLLRSGHIDEGLEIIRAVPRSVDARYPRTPRRALASLLFTRLRLALRGLGWRERAEAQIAPEDLTRLDIIYALGNSLAPIDVIRAAEIQARNTLLSLEAGERSRVIRALMWEVLMAAIEGNGGSPRSRRILASAELAAERGGLASDLGRITATGAVVAYTLGQFRRAVDLALHAAHLFRAESAAFTWEIVSLQSWFLLPALFQLGDVRALRRLAPPVAREARDRGDRYALTVMATLVLPLLHLCDGRPAEARRVSTEALAAWSTRGVQAQHWIAAQTLARVHLYEGDGATALGVLERIEPALRRTLLFRVQNLRLQHNYLAATAALAAAAAGKGAEGDLLALAERLARGLERERNAWATALAACVRAGLGALRGEPHASDRLAEAARGFEALSMDLHVHAARRRQGELLGGAAGAELAAAADAAMAGIGVVDPARMAALLVAPVRPASRGGPSAAGRPV